MMVHSMITKILYHFGIRGNARNLFSSYLSNRQHFVSIHSCQSVQEYVHCGYLGEVSWVLPSFLIYIMTF